MIEVKEVLSTKYFLNFYAEFGGNCHKMLEVFDFCLGKCYNKISIFYRKDSKNEKKC